MRRRILTLLGKLERMVAEGKDPLQTGISDLDKPKKSAPKKTAPKRAAPKKTVKRAVPKKRAIRKK